MAMVQLRSLSLLLAALLTAAGAASAQNPAPPQSPTLAADRAQIAACLRQGAAQAGSCIGLVAVACVRAASDRRIAEPACARREEAVWRERLTQGAAMTARTLDAGQRSRLASVQLAWEGYIAQKCGFYGSRQREGLQVGRQAGCELREVALRAIEIERGVAPAAGAPARPQQGRPEIYR